MNRKNFIEESNEMAIRMLQIPEDLQDDAPSVFDREVYVVGSINMDMAMGLMNELRRLDAEDDTSEIRMIINSPGGDVNAGFIILDCMQLIHAPVHTICVGMAASMASLIFSGGQIREIYPHANVMIHDPSMICHAPDGQVAAMRMQDMQDVHSQLMRQRERIGKQLAVHTGQGLKTIYKRCAAETTFYGTEAVEFGLADFVAVPTKLVGARSQKGLKVGGPSDRAYGCTCE